MGKPVALLARNASPADSRVRLNHDHTPGLKGEPQTGHLNHPVSYPDLAEDGQGGVALIRWYSLSSQGLCQGHSGISPSAGSPHQVEVLNRANDYRIVGAVAPTSISNSFHPIMLSSIKTRMDRAEFESGGMHSVELTSRL